MHNNVDWNPLTLNAARQMIGAKNVLVIRGDGKGYFGRIIEVTMDYAVLANGKQRQILTFHGTPIQYARINPPVRPVPQMGHPRLNLEKTDG